MRIFWTSQFVYPRFQNRIASTKRKKRMHTIQNMMHNVLGRCNIWVMLRFQIFFQSWGSEKYWLINQLYAWLLFLNGTRAPVWCKNISFSIRNQKRSSKTSIPWSIKFFSKKKILHNDELSAIISLLLQVLDYYTHSSHNKASDWSP